MKNVDRRCFVATDTYENRSKSIDIGRTPNSVIFPAPYIHASILAALRGTIRAGSVILVIEQGTGYMTACLALMAGEKSVTVSSLHDNQLRTHATTNIKNWLKDEKIDNTYHLEVGKQIKLITDDALNKMLLNTRYNAIYIRSTHGSDVYQLQMQLTRGGRLVCLQGADKGEQQLYQIDLLYTGKFQRTNLAEFKNFEPDYSQTTSEEITPPRQLGTFSVAKQLDCLSFHSLNRVIETHDLHTHSFLAEM
ncbi:unnamed protein product [Trichobilharzia regenti]|nr:unnamed protein product [Trichobilharzia regenti]